MKKITKSKLYFDNKGNLYLPKDLKFGGMLSPSLNPREWWCLVLEVADKSQMSEKQTTELFDSLCGSKSSQYRSKRALKSKGYL